MAGINQQPRFAQGSRRGPLFQKRAATPIRHRGQQPVHIIVAPTLQRHGHSLARPPTRITGEAPQNSQRIALPLCQQSSLPAHSAEHQKLLRRVDRRLFGTQRQPACELAGAAQLRHSSRQLQIAARAGQSRFAQQKRLPGVQRSQCFAVVVDSGHLAVDWLQAGDQLAAMERPPAIEQQDGVDDPQHQAQRQRQPYIEVQDTGDLPDQQKHNR